jgi:diguanylate cyclase (GGDEF)-like protein
MHQQINIINLLFSAVFLLMAITNQILCRAFLIKDFVRILMIISFGMHFGLEVSNSFSLEASNLLSRASWSFYHIAGSLAIAFIFLERLFTDHEHHTASCINNYFMLSASIIAVVAIPLGIIIRDRMGFQPIPALIIGTSSFILSSIVIWRLQKLIWNINQQREKLKTIAYTDPLTGLHNYHGYLDKLSSKNNENLLVVSLNVEDFKSINDLYGRSFGDDVLKSLAKRLEKTPGTILVARTGSDYFQAVFKTPEKDITNLIKKIQEYLGIWDEVNSRRIAVPITFGASHSANAVKSESLARQAEQALKISRNTHTDFTLYSKNKSENVKSNMPLPRHELREILQKAVDDDFLPIHFQPIYNLQNGNLKALEMLIRVESKEHGLLLPGQFLEQAQAYGLLTSLTQVCVNMVAKCYGELPDVTVNINVPPYMLNNPQVLEEFIDCFTKANLPMERFCIEVTEDGDIPTEHLIPAINLLKSKGFKIAMDDFGTGYSSLSRLSVLPVDVVKIDRSLLLAASAGNTSILESAISLTKRLGASTVVEGVETLEQLSLIRKLGADSVQGFLLSRPVQISKASLLSLNAVDIIPEF